MTSHRMQALSYSDPSTYAAGHARGRRLFVLAIVLLTISSLSDALCLARAAAGHDMGFVLEWSLILLLFATVLNMPVAIVAALWTLLALARGRSGERKYLIAALVVLMFHGAATIHTFKTVATWLPVGIH